MAAPRIRRALISVSDKSGIEGFARMLSQMGVEILSTGGTHRALAEAGVSLDEDDLAELEALVQRQKRLRTLFESILERLQESEDSGEEI